MGDDVTGIPTEQSTAYPAFREYLSSTGRLARLPFLLLHIMLLIVSVFGSLLVAAIGTLAEKYYVGAFIFAFILAAVVLWFVRQEYVLAMKRQHDFNVHSNIRALLIFVPFVNLIVLGVLLLRKGTNGLNDHGPEPPGWTEM